MISGEEIVAAAIATINDAGRQPPLEFDRLLSLKLEDGAIDSLDLIDIVMGVESGLSEAIGRRVVLVGTGTFDPEDNPFATLGALLDRVNEVLGSGAA